MKITIDKNELSEALTQVQNAVSNRPTIPILNNILLSTDNDSLTLTATDLNICITTKANCTVDNHGKTTLPARKFSQIIKQLPNDAVTISVDENNVASISCKKSFFKISGLDVADYPQFNQEEDFREYTLNSAVLRKMLNKVSYASSTDETRLVLNGVLLSIRDNKLTTVATDGRRLALMEIDMPENSADGDTILTAQSVTELQKLLSDDGDVTLHLGESMAIFDVSHTQLFTKVREGNYPNFKQVIPQSFGNKTSIDRMQVANAINRVSVILDDASSSIKMALENNQAIVQSTSNADESSEPVEVDYQGEPITIALNPSFIQEPLKRLECQAITLQFTDNISPICLLGDAGFKYIIMPMRN